MATTLLTRFFQPAGASTAAEYPLEYPLAPAPRICVLGFGIRREKNVIPLAGWRRDARELERAESLAGSFLQIWEVGVAAARGLIRLPRLAYPLVVITRIGEAPLGAEEHDELWRTFGLPVLEQIRDSEGRLLAFECEARRGFHTTNPEALAPGFESLAGPCPCGLPEPLVLPVPSTS